MIGRARVATVAAVLGAGDALLAFGGVWFVGRHAGSETWLVSAALLSGFAVMGGILTTFVAIWVLRRAMARETVAPDAVRIAVFVACLFVAVFGLLTLSPAGWSLAVIGTAALVLMTHVVLSWGLAAER